MSTLAFLGLIASLVLVLIAIRFHIPRLFWGSVLAGVVHALALLILT